jgi:hypothetical protein
MDVAENMADAIKYGGWLFVFLIGSRAVAWLLLIKHSGCCFYECRSLQLFVWHKVGAADLRTRRQASKLVASS